MLTTMDTAQLADREDDLLDDCLAHLRYSIEDPCYAARRYAALTHPFLIMKLYGTTVRPSPSKMMEYGNMTPTATTGSRHHTSAIANADSWTYPS